MAPEPSTTTRMPTSSATQGGMTIPGRAGGGVVVVPSVGVAAGRTSTVDASTGSAAAGAATVGCSALSSGVLLISSLTACSLRLCDHSEQSGNRGLKTG